MLTLYRQEIFKLSKRKGPLMAMGILAVFNLLVAIVIKLNGKMFNAVGVFAANFLSTWLVALLLIGATATIVTSEFEYNTIKNIIYQAGSRQRVLVSKWLATLTYMVFLYAYMLVLNLLLKLILFNTNFSLSDKDGKFFIYQEWLYSAWGGFVKMLLVSSLVFLIAVLMKKSSAAIMVGTLTYLAVTLIGNVMEILLRKWEFLKWNPLNFTNYGNQLVDPTFANITHLTTNQLLWGSLAYTAVFLALGMWVFANKEV